MSLLGSRQRDSRRRVDLALNFTVLLFIVYHLSGEVSRQSSSHHHAVMQKRARRRSQSLPIHTVERNCAGDASDVQLLEKRASHFNPP